MKNHLETLADLKKNDNGIEIICAVWGLKSQLLWLIGLNLTQIFKVD